MIFIQPFRYVVKIARQMKPSERLPSLHAEFKRKHEKLNKAAFWVSLPFCKRRHPFLLLWTVPFLFSKQEEAGTKKPEPKYADLKKEIQKAIENSDELFTCNKFQEAATALIPFQGSGDVEVLWRLGRAQFKHAQQPSVVEPEKGQLIASAYAVLCEALAQDEHHWAVHKWFSVLLDARSTYDGIKARVSQLEKVKEHMLRAAELNPKDATTLYMLGSWCYHIADMPWFQRKIAATIFAEPPKSSFEEALYYFTKAEEVQPRFYRFCFSQNLLMVGKTLLKLQRPMEAFVYLCQARNFPSSCEEDDQVRKEAAEILKNLKITEDRR